MKRVDRVCYEARQLILPETRMVGWSRFAKAMPMGLGPHAHDDAYEICLIVKGGVDWWVEDELYEITHGQVFITRPGERHGGVDAVMHPNELYWVQVRWPAKGPLPGLSAAESSRLARALSNIKHRCFPASPDLARHYERMLSEHARRGPEAIVSARAALHALLVDVLRDHQAHARNLRDARRQSSSGVTQAKKIIDARLDQPLRLNELADELGMSVSHFRQRFVKELGISPGRYVVSRRVTFAKKLLHDPALSITQIATQLGFSSSQHLATTFRQWTGVSPTAYRAGLKHGQPMA